MKKQEEESGVKYQEVQQAQAQEIMGEDIEGKKETFEGGISGHPQAPGDDNSGDEQKEHKTDAIRKFEAHREDTENRTPISKDRYVFLPPYYDVPNDEQCRQECYARSTQSLR